MASKKKNEFNFFDSEYLGGGGDALSAMIEEKKIDAPSEKDIEILEKADGEFADIPVRELIDYSNHTFNVVDDEEMAILVDSLKDYGIFVPLIVRKVSDHKYEVLSGHRRKFAAKKAGLESVPCKIVDVDDDMADIIMADTNISRETIRPSEKAKTYKVRYEAAVRQGKKKKESLGEMAAEAPDSIPGIRRYLKIASLRPALLAMIDDERMPLNAGVAISSLSPKHQDILVEVLKENETIPVTLKMAENIKTAAARGLTKETAEAIVAGEKKVRKSQQTKKPSANIFSRVSADDKEYILGYASDRGMSVEDVISKCVSLLKAGK